VKKIIILSLLSLFTSLVFADNYQFQVDGTYTISRDDPDLDHGIKTWKTTATYFLSNVDDVHGPLAKASFLNKSSSISVDYSKTESHSETKYSGNMVMTSSRPEIIDRGIKGKIVAGPGIILEADYHITSGKYDGSVPGRNSTLDTRTYNLAGGVYISDSTAVKLRYYHTDSGNNYSAKAYLVDYEQVTRLANDTYIGINGAIAHLKHEYGSVNSIGGHIDYYFNRQFSMGAGVVTDSTHEYIGYDIGAQYFINSHVGLSANYSVIDFDDGDNAEMLIVNFTGRF
jgi:hypothetical protein